MKAVASNTIVYFKAGKQLTEQLKSIIFVPRIVDLVTVNNTPIVRAISRSTPPTSIKNDATKQVISEPSAKKSRSNQSSPGWPIQMLARTNLS